MEGTHTRDRKGVNLDGSEGGEELGEAERGKSVIRLYCIRI